MNYLRNIALKLTNMKRYTDNEECLFYVNRLIEDIKDELVDNIKNLEYELEQKKNILKLIESLEGRGADKNETRD